MVIFVCILRVKTNSNGSFTDKILSCISRRPSVMSIGSTSPPPPPLPNKEEMIPLTTFVSGLQQAGLKTVSTEGESIMNLNYFLLAEES